jgi:hypothetical protein
MELIAVNIKCSRLSPHLWVISYFSRSTTVIYFCISEIKVPVIINDNFLNQLLDNEEEIMTSSFL